MRIETKYRRRLAHKPSAFSWRGLEAWGRAQEIAASMDKMLWFASPGMEFSPEQLAGARGFLVNLG